LILMQEEIPALRTQTPRTCARRPDVHHFGPDPAHVGGMGSVLRIMQEHHLGGGKVNIHPTWRAHARVASLLLSLRGAARIVTLRGEQIVHVHLAENGSFLREGALVVLGGSLGRGTVATIHGAHFLEFSDRRRRLASFVLRRADLVTCLDHAVLERVREIAPETRVSLMPNPIAIDDCSPSADTTDEVVLFAGEIGLRKGADVLRRAWPTVKAARPGARCIMVGPAKDFAVPPADGLEVRAPVGAGELRLLLRSARVVALPSRAEGMPMILTEAMSAGRPFVSTPVGGIPELAVAGGLLVDVNDDGGLARELIGLLGDRDRAREIGEAGRRFCRDTRSVEVLDVELAELYLTAAARV
jgi:glycosyltransferase involved in cell wall biosynthesis